MHKLTAISLAVFLLTQSDFAAAQALPAPSKMQVSFGQVITNFAKARGFAANDPRVYKTLYQVGRIAVADAALVGTVVAGTAVAGATAPGWASILAVTAISTGLTYAIPLTYDAFIKWQFGSTDTPVTSVTASTDTAPIYYPSNDLSGSQCQETINVTNHCSPQSASLTFCLAPMQPNPTNACVDDATMTFDQAISQAGFEAVAPPSTIESSPQTLAQTVSSLTPEQLAKPVNPQAVAKMTELLMKQAAAQPGYEGIPFPAGSVITPDMVLAPGADPAALPSVGDFVAPQTDIDNAFSPANTASSSTSPGSGTTANTYENPEEINAPADATKVDLGPDPGVGPPLLEQTPTASAILAPIFGMMPSLKNYVVPAHTGTCPRPEFNVFNQQIVMTSHCDLLEPNRELIHGFMMAAFGIAAAVIILKA